MKERSWTLYDKYGTLRAKDTVPIVVAASLRPPFWDTFIGLLPCEDEENPIYWPLNQCMFQPGQVENILEKEHMKEVQKCDETMRKSRWGGMMHQNNRNRNRNKGKEKDKKNGERDKEM